MKIFSVLLLSLLALLQYQLWLGDSGFKATNKLVTVINAQKLENQQLQTRNKLLLAEVLDLKTGLAAIEEKARNDMGMIRKDEKFLQYLQSSLKKKVNFI